jgi:hypothetical protein
MSFTGTWSGGQRWIADEPPPLADEPEHATLGAVGEHLARR